MQSSSSLARTAVSTCLSLSIGCLFLLSDPVRATSQPVGLLYLGAATAPGASSVSTAGSRAYVAKGTGGLQVFDLSNPGYPLSLGTANLTAWFARVTNGVAFIAGGRGLEVWNVTNPSQPAVLGTCNLRGTPSGFDQVGSYAYVASGDEGLQVVDLSNTSAPGLAGKFPRWLTDTLTARDVRVAGDYAFVAGDTQGLVILSLQSLDYIAVKSSLALGAPAMTLELVGTTAYVTTTSGQLYMIDVSDPAKPKLIGEYPQKATAGVTFGEARIAGHLVFLPAGSNGIQVLDVTDPTNPVLAGGFQSYGPVNAIALDGDRVLAAQGTAGLLALQTVEGGTPPSISTQPADQTIPLNSAAHFSVQTSGAGPFTFQWLFGTAPIAGANGSELNFGNVGRTNEGPYAVIVSSQGGSLLSQSAKLQTVAPPVVVTQPSDRTVVESNSVSLKVSATPATPLSYQWFFNGQAISGAVKQSLTLDPVRLQDAGAYSVLVTNIAGSMLSSNAQLTVLPLVRSTQWGRWTQTNVDDVAISGTHAYLACGTDGLHILDLTNPTNLVELGNVPSREFTYTAQITNGIAYIADGLKGGLQIVDVSDPAAPKRLNSFKSNTYIHAVRIVDQRAYLAAGSAGLVVLDISTPSQPVFLGNIVGDDDADRVDVAGHYAYTAEGLGGCGIYDVTDPTKLLEAGRIENLLGAYYVRDVRVHGGELCLAIGYDGFERRSLAKPAAPFLIGWDTSLFGQAVQDDGHYAYLAGYNKGVGIYDLSSGGTPQKVASFSTPGAANGLDVVGNLLLIADGEAGLIVYELTTNSAEQTPLRLATQWEGTSGQLRVQVNDSSAQTIVLEESSDLTHWQPVLTNSVPSNGVFDFLSPVATGKTGFFRAHQ